MQIQRAKKKNPKKERMNHFLVNQATPRFELGKEDLKSPALPLGHVVKNFEKKKKKKISICLGV
jgi:hypothetical protein